MMFYLLGGLGIGVVFYFVKLAGFMMFTRSKWTRWLHDCTHSGPLGLFILDTLAGFLIIDFVKLCGSEGLTTLFVVIGFSISSMVYILTVTAAKKARKVLFAKRRYA